jgi:hypothetical protein
VTISDGNAGADDRRSWVKRNFSVLDLTSVGANIVFWRRELDAGRLAFRHVEDARGRRRRLVSRDDLQTYLGMHKIPRPTALALSLRGGVS